MSLRTRLLVGLLLLCVVLLVTDVVLAVTFHRVLIDQVDRRLAEAVPPALQAAGVTPSPVFPDQTTTLPPISSFPGSSDGSRPPISSLTDVYVEMLAPGQAPVMLTTPALGVSRDRPPRLTAMLGAHADRRAFTAPADGHGAAYRALLVPLTGRRQVFAVAVSLRDTDAALRHVVLLELLGTAVALVGLGGVATWILRQGVRPLDRIAATAEAIADGDLSRRVEPLPPKTEVGRLAASLNTMLGQIEAAFDEKTASEGRLRRFVADASHELRTPLTSIRGYAELWRRGGLGDRAAEADAVARIEQEATRMGGLVDDLLLLAQLDQARPVQRDVVHLGLLAGDIVDDARATDASHTIVLEAADVSVAGDVNQLHQAIANLVANSLQHTPPGTHVTLRVTTGGDHAVVEVEDDGPGVAPQDALRIFERFYRADQSRSRHDGGAGLGLAIVASIARAHGGHAGLRPSPGRGALFWISLPLYHPPVPTGTPADTRPQAAGPNPADAASVGLPPASAEADATRPSRRVPPTQS